MVSIVVETFINLERDSLIDFIFQFESKKPYRKLLKELLLIKKALAQV